MDLLQPKFKNKYEVNTEPWTRYLNPGPDACYNLNLKINMKLTLNPGPNAVVSSVSTRVVHQRETKLAYWGGWGWLD